MYHLEQSTTIMINLILTKQLLQQDDDLQTQQEPKPMKEDVAIRGGNLQQDDDLRTKNGRT
jgi:hypothetical protein